MKHNIEQLLNKGISEVIVKEHLEKELLAGKKLRIKFGADPTSADLHLGHAVAFRKLRQFQDAGHKIVFIIGDYTAKVGDPTGKSKARPSLTDKEIEANAETYFAQVSKIIDVKKAEIHYNSEWFAKEHDWAVRLSRLFTSQQILKREDFAKRWAQDIEVYVSELLYPIMQAYDSVKIEADVEVGGTDQKFNMLAGRDLQRHLGLKEQDVITLPLLVGTDGVHKMSKSLGNYIGISEEPNSMFGKLMSVPDALIDSYYELCTDETRKGSDPRDAKLDLAEAIVDIYHGKGAGKTAREEFISIHSKKEKPKEIEEMRLGVKEISLIDLLVKSKLAKSKSESRRLIEQGGVKIDDVKQSDPASIIDLSSPRIVQVGPRKFLKIKA